MAKTCECRGAPCRPRLPASAQGPREPRSSPLARRMPSMVYMLSDCAKAGTAQCCNYNPLPLQSYGPSRLTVLTRSEPSGACLKGWHSTGHLLNARALALLLTLLVLCEQWRYTYLAHSSYVQKHAFQHSHQSPPWLPRLALLPSSW